MKKRIISLILAMAMALSFTACKKPEDLPKPPTQSSSEVMSSMESSEYPSSQESLSSETSSEVSSIVSQISSTPSSKPASKPASSKPANKTPVKKPASSKPVSSKPVSSKPASSKPVSSKPVAKPPQGDNVSHDVMKAVWIAFLEFDSFKGSDEATFTNKVNYYFDTAVAKGLNTVIVQVRPHGDSMYASAYYPWSKHVSGTMGVGVSYDPLAIMVSEAHNRGLEIHAWINPYRTMSDAEFADVDNSFLTKQWYESGNRNQYMVKQNDGRWWLQPGNSEVQQLIINGAQEIVSNYKVDGVHIDDYFYGGSVASYGDTPSQAKANTTAMVQGLYNAVHQANSKCKFGVSPAGGFNANASIPNSDMGYLSTDLALWCQNDGYIDYVMPQIYWGYNHSSQPFLRTLGKWEEFVTAPSVALYTGLAPYKINTGLISHSEILQQMQDSLKDGASGYALFRFDHIVNL